MEAYGRMEFEFKKLYANWMFVHLQCKYPLMLSSHWCMNEKLRVVLQYFDDHWNKALFTFPQGRVMDDFNNLCRIKQLPYDQFMLGTAFDKAAKEWLQDIRMMVFDMFGPKPEQCDA